MKILSNKRYGYLLDCTNKYIDYLSGPLTPATPALLKEEYERGLAAARADARLTEREKFIAKLRAAFLDNPSVTLADLLKEYDCKVTPPTSNPFASMSWASQLTAQSGALQQWPR